MKPFLSLSFVLFCLVLFVDAQNNKKQSGVSSDPDLEIYTRAMQFNDIPVARNALFHLIQKHSDQLSWQDSLVRLYFFTGDYASCIQAGNDYMSKDTSNISLISWVGQSYAALGNHREAADLFERLYLRTGNIQYAYQLAVNQYQIQRFGECNQMIDIILHDPACGKERLVVEDRQGKRQSIPLSAASWNLRGLIYKDLNQVTNATDCFDKAIEAYPDFSQAKENKSALSPAPDPSNSPQIKDSGKK